MATAGFAGFAQQKILIPGRFFALILSAASLIEGVVDRDAG